MITLSTWTNNKLIAASLSGYVCAWDLDLVNTVSNSLASTENLENNACIFSIQGGCQKDCWTILPIDEESFACGSGKDINIYNIKNPAKQITQLLGHHDTVRDLLLYGHGRQILSCSDDKSIRIWDIDRACCLHVIRIGEPIRKLFGVKDNIVLFSASLLGRLKIWINDFDLCLMDQCGHEGGMHHMTDGPDNSLVTTGRDKRIRFWSLALLCPR